jgi:pyruvate formate lyase activating enzyme
MSDLTARVTAIQRFCTHDGDGIRTTVFLKGCPLSCRWCHNPETQSKKQQFFFNEKLCISCGACAAVCKTGVHQSRENRENCIGCGECAAVCPGGAIEMCSREMPVDEVLKEVLADKAFYGEVGGLTVSGGEPMANPEFTLELLRRAKAEGLSTAVETCGLFDEKYVEPLSAVCDIFLWDFKDGNSARHKEMTGVGNEKILSNLKAIDKFDVRIILRCIMVRGVNIDEENLSKIAETFKNTAHCEAVELLSYHAYGGSKSARLGSADSSNADWIPTDSDIAFVNSFLKNNGVLLKK